MDLCPKVLNGLGRVLALGIYPMVKSTKNTPSRSMVMPGVVIPGH